MKPARVHAPAVLVATLVHAATTAASPSAHLSWSRSAQIEDWSSTTERGTPLFLRIADAPAQFSELAVAIEWTPNNLLGPCYTLNSDSAQASPDGYWTFVQPPLVRSGTPDSVYLHQLHLPAGIPSSELVFEFVVGRGGSCTDSPATFCLKWVEFVDAMGASTFAEILGGATLFGGDSSCGIAAQAIFPRVAEPSPATAFEIVGSGYSPAVSASLEIAGAAHGADTVSVLSPGRIRAVFDTRGLFGQATVVLGTQGGGTAFIGVEIIEGGALQVAYDPKSVILWSRPGRLSLPPGEISASLGVVSATPGLMASLLDLGVDEIRSCSPASLLDPVAAARLADPGQLDVFQLVLADTNVTTTCSQLSADSANVIECHPNWRYELLDVVPGDDLMAKSWHLRNTGAWPPNDGSMAGEDCGASGAWGISTGGAPVLVGVLDTGGDPQHPDLVGRYSDGEIPTYVTGVTDPADWCGHGSSVAGIVAAQGNDPRGGRAVGVDWNALVRSYKVAYGSCIIDDASVTACVDYAMRDRCRILNMSFAVISPSRSTEDFFYNAFHAGVLSFAGSGNYYSYFRSWPAEYSPYVLSVGASLYKGGRWSDGRVGWRDSWGYTDSIPNNGSSYGNFLKFLAPGGRFIATTAWPSTYRDPDPTQLWYPRHPTQPWIISAGSRYFGFSGTSAAAPVASGAAALIRSVAGDSLGGEEIVHLLALTARPVPGQLTRPSPEAGWGTINLKEALWAVRPGTRVERGVAIGGTVTDTVAGPIVDVYSWPGITTSGPRLGCRSSARTIRRTVVFGEPFVGKPLVLKRTHGSVGVMSIPAQIRDSSHPPEGFSIPRWEPAFDTLAAYPDSCVLSCKVYALYSNGVRYWWPCSLESVRFAYTLVGVPQSALAVGPAPTESRMRLTVGPSPSRDVIVVEAQGVPGNELALELLDVQGRRLIERPPVAIVTGRCTVRWALNGDGIRLSPGLYFVRARAGTQAVVRHAVVLR